MTRSISYVFSVLYPVLVYSSYSVYYKATEDGPKLISGELVAFAEPPSSNHIADIYARLSGLAPILREGINFAAVIDLSLNFRRRTFKASYG